MGTRGMSNFSNLVMGSVATRVVHEVTVPVLLVK
jgi:nucleotide-binding universal stress UspA family protein